MVPRERGFALLIVLWSLVLIGLLTTQIVASGRTAMVLASNLRAGAQGQAAADGAIDETIFHLLGSGGNRWQADGSVHVLSGGGLPITVRIESLSGRINPNLASAALLAGLFQAVGASRGQAQQEADGIIEWRTPPKDQKQEVAQLATYQRLGLAEGPPGHNFADLSELADVANMPPGLLASALPYLSLYQTGNPDPRAAAPLVRRALALSGQPGIDAVPQIAGVSVVSIQAVAGIEGSLVVRREAIVSITSQNRTAPFRMLSLENRY